MKNEKGVTLIALVTTIALIIILAAITTYTGIESYQSMRTQAFVSKMIALQEKVDTFCEKYTVSEINNMGVTYDNLSDTEAKSVLTSVISDGEAGKLNSWFSVDNSTGNYRYFSIDAIEGNIGLANFDVAIWLNPATRNVIAVEGIKVDDVTYYRQYDLTGGQTLREPAIVNDFTLDYKLLTYDNKAVVKFTRKYKKVTYTYGTQTVSFNNVSEIELPYSGTYKIEATDQVTYKIEETDQVTSGDLTKSVDGLSVTIVNKPLLVDGMTPIMPEGATTYEEWYNYDSSVKNWANVKLKDGSVYVWIPRYAYKISGTTIDVKFLKDFSEVTTEGKALATEYKIAPAFRNGASTDFANGEWDSEITGFWVAKYEATNKSNVPQTILSNAVDGWKLTPKDAYKNCRAMEQQTSLFGTTVTSKVNGFNNGVYATDTNNIDTHLIKNSEWGAITYLTYSNYGAKATNAQPGIYPGKDCGDTINTTGNATGIYGMSGGNLEITASGLIITEYNSLGTSNKYATKYPTTNTNTTIFGDAVNSTEISGFGVTNTLPTTSNPIFLRGGSLTSGNIFIYQNHATSAVNCFRPVIIVEY